MILKMLETKLTYNVKNKDQLCNLPNFIYRQDLDIVLK